MRNKILTSAATILVGAFLAAADAGAYPTGVPVVSPAPLACPNDSTTGSTWSITLQSNTPGGPIPYSEQCQNNPGTCSTYEYKISTPIADHVYVAVSSDQNLDHTVPGENAGVRVFPPTIGTGPSENFLQYAAHEYAIELTPTGSWDGVLKISVVGASVPRISTVLMAKGKTKQPCLIAGPGVAGDHFQPVPTSETVVVSGGKCKVIKVFDAAGKLTRIDPAPDMDATCHIVQGDVMFLDGSKLRNNTSPSGITFGDNTTTCYGPPVPSIPWCVTR
jgi:hypothetical protein